MIENIPAKIPQKVILPLEYLISVYGVTKIITSKKIPIIEKTTINDLLNFLDINAHPINIINNTNSKNKSNPEDALRKQPIFNDFSSKKVLSKSTCT